jgi:hypothetical protein
MRLHRRAESFTFKRSARFVRATRLLAAAATLAGLALVPVIASAPAQASGCAAQTKILWGSVSGSNGYYVNAMLGFDIKDSHGRTIDPNGCPRTAGGYGATQHVNYCLTSNGAATSAPRTDYGQVPACAHTASTKQWGIWLPSNAASVYIEVYPKKQSGAPQFGVTEYGRFAMAYKRSVPTTGAYTLANITMPAICHRGAGNLTGSLYGYFYKGNTRWYPHAGTVNAWSVENANVLILGMGIGSVDAQKGMYTIPYLALLSHYTLIANLDGVGHQFLTGNLPVVGSCTNTRYDLHF